MMVNGKNMTAVLAATLLICTGACAQAMETTYAECFSVETLEGNVRRITLEGDQSFLLIPEGGTIPEDTQGAVVLQQPLDGLYISSTPVMSMIDAMGALDSVSLTTYERDDWYIPGVWEAMDAGEIVYAGGYRAPDYEMLTAQMPPLLMCSTMIYDTPEVKQKLDELGIPQLVDCSSKEPHPLGRLEWIKLYGLLLGCEEEAETAFRVQEDMVKNMTAAPEGKTVACCYVTSKGKLYVRRGGDYMTRMLEMAGATYLPADLEPEKTGSAVLEMEAFYEMAGEADVLLYNWSLGGKPESLEELKERHPMLAEFKAVKNGEVYCTSASWFQTSAVIGEMIADMGAMLGGGEMTHLYKLQ